MFVGAAYAEGGSFREIAHKKLIRISDRIEARLYLKADPFAIDRLVNNLMDNAIRYTDEKGAVEVALKGAGEQIKLVVKDNGRGISEEEQKHIFTPYHQISH